MSGQKFVGRNRAPRVQIEYDVEVYGAQKKVQLPFVMGVLSDLSGKPVEPLPPVADREFQEIDVDNFDSRMKSIKPRVAFQVPPPWPITMAWCCSMRPWVQPSRCHIVTFLQGSCQTRRSACWTLRVPELPFPCGPPLHP
ncbi:type VI secretion system contractile sheath small subunit [Limnobacter litoralis]|uniref:type VI secretion system contractile sheath small subunit n=1 Tax=Limnobacter litoralis TaxID=481366 RepID=UPI0024E091FB|nr:type VI secretion system contractile sheath small subunit [Limnobacter litoralis]